MKYRVSIIVDDDYDPGNYSDNAEENRECTGKLKSGEWQAYAIIVTGWDDEKNPCLYQCECSGTGTCEHSGEPGWEHVDSLGGVVTVAGYDDTSCESVDEIQWRIRDPYLIDHVLDMWPADATVTPEPSATDAAPQDANDVAETLTVSLSATEARILTDAATIITRLFGQTQNGA